MMITAETKTKYQKNGNIHNYVYYRCTRKSKIIKCRESFVRQEILDKQISNLIQKVSLRQDWADKLTEMAEKDNLDSAQSVIAFVQKSNERINAINSKLQVLLDGYLDQDIEREIYRSEKAKLMSEKRTLEEKISQAERKQNAWLGPMKEWIKKASNLDKIAQDNDLFSKKVIAKEIFGSDLLLANRETRLGGPSGIRDLDFMPTTQWAALRAAQEMTSDFPESRVTVWLYSQVRTYFIKNS